MTTLRIFLWKKGNDQIVNANYRESFRESHIILSNYLPFIRIEANENVQRIANLMHVFCHQFYTPWQLWAGVPRWGAPQIADNISIWWKCIRGHDYFAYVYVSLLLYSWIGVWKYSPRTQRSQRHRISRCTGESGRSDRMTALRETEPQMNADERRFDARGLHLRGAGSLLAGLWWREQGRGLGSGSGRAQEIVCDTGRVGIFSAPVIYKIT